MENICRCSVSVISYRRLPLSTQQVTGRAFLGQQLAGGLATAPVRGLKRLELTNCRSLEGSAVEWIAAGCTCLDALIVSGCSSTTPEGIELLAGTPPALSHLGISGCVRMGHSALTFVAERGQNLQHLDISDIPSTTAGVVGKFLRHCGRLESIDVSGLTRVDRSSFRDLGEGDTISTSNALSDPHVMEQSRSLGGDTHPSSTAAEGAVSELVRGARLPHLLVARMLRLPKLDDSSVIRFATACPHLEELLLSDSPLVTGACLVPLSSLCPLLRSLGLDRCSAASDEPALAAALRYLPGLEHLGAARKGHGSPSLRLNSGTEGRVGQNLRGRAPFGGADFVDFINDGVGVENSTYRGGAPVSGVTLLTEASRWCTQLTTLGLEGHECLTFASDHAPPGAFPCLTELRLSACSAVDDTGLVVLLKACPRVRTLKLAGSGVSQIALVEAATQLPFVDVLPSPHVGKPPASSSTSRQRCRTHPETPTTSVSSGVFPPKVSPPPPPSSEAPARAVKAILRTAVEKPGSKPSSTASRVDPIKVQGAVGLRPTVHCGPPLAALAMFARFEEEKVALKRLVRALRLHRDRRNEERKAAGRRIHRAMAAYRFRTSCGHPDQVRPVISTVRVHASWEGTCIAWGFPNRIARQPRN